MLNYLQIYLGLSDSVKYGSEIRYAPKHLQSCIHVACVSDINESASFWEDVFLIHFLLDFDLSSLFEFLSAFGSHNEQLGAFR